MPIVVGVRFQNAGKLFYFTPGNLNPAAGEPVIVETARGLEYAEAVLPPHEIADTEKGGPFKRLVRIATADDMNTHLYNKQLAADAYQICQEKIAHHKLDMKLVKVEYTFDRNKLIAYFTSNGRVDFRALVKDLASTFRTRIELKQIGVRDEAKMIGGLGICGRSLCCSKFLGDFQPVSIRMAKEQNLSLNPSKISGVCGRLMCCLKYEEEHYAKARKSMPQMGKEAITPDGSGTVVELNVLKEMVKVRFGRGPESETREYPACEVRRASPPAAAAKQQSKTRRGSKQAKKDAPGNQQMVDEPQDAAPEN